jgi:phenylpropionate dioxygenase-like ring-hydroxylating dioxygenase large terminal subunit
MVHIPTRGDTPVRLGPEVDLVPDFGPSTLNRDVYSDPSRFELERERVLATHWLLAGRVEQIPEAGDWLTYEGHGETVIVTRQPNSSLAAFHNVCQHRGPAIVGELSGCGARRFTCPYHGWVYDTTGRVVAIPEREDFAAEHVDDVRAPNVAVDQWAGWIWINLAGPTTATPLADAIGPEITADLGRFQMEEMVLHEVLEWDVPVSYKAIVDGFNEIYHTRQLHHVDADWSKAARQSSFHIVGDNYMCFVPRSQHLDKLAEDWDHHRYAICHYVVFPNTVFNCNPDHIQVFNPIPLGVDRTRFLCWELIYQGDLNDPVYDDYHRRTMAHWETLKDVVGEDIAIYDQLARTSHSSGYRQNILNERECKIAHYHENMASKIEDPQS